MVLPFKAIYIFNKYQVKGTVKSYTGLRRKKGEKRNNFILQEDHVFFILDIFVF